MTEPLTACPRCGSHLAAGALCAICNTCFCCGAQGAVGTSGICIISHASGCVVLEDSLADMEPAPDAPAPRPKVVPITSSAKAVSNFAWSPEQCLADALERVRSGAVSPASVIVLFVEDVPGGGQCTHSQRSSIGVQEEFFWLHVAQQQCLERMRS